MFEEFKKFALRGNVVDLAVGVIIGAAFGAIVTSLVSDIIMPIIGAITGGLDFSNYYLPLSSKVLWPANCGIFRAVLCIVVLPEGYSGNTPGLPSVR